MAENRITRRQFVGDATAAATALTLTARDGYAAGDAPVLLAGEGVIDATPPLGIEMAGFHRPPGKERRIAGIRQPAAARALLLQIGNAQAAIVSLDTCGVSRDMAARVQAQIAKQLGIPARHVRLCATHTHSMPTFRYFRQWGAVATEYRTVVEERILRAVRLARDDLAPAELHLGKSRAEGASFNRTSKTWKTDKEFTKDSTDADRWLDTMVRVMHFRRGGGHRDLLWYHFSAHPVCYTDDNAGPDWPGLVEKQIREKEKLSPSFLQGHCGDVNPGGGQPWLGIAEDVAGRVAGAVRRAIDGAARVKTDRLRILNRQVKLPLDIERFKQWLDIYRQDPSKCDHGPWVDARFAKDWFAGASKWDLTQTHLPISVTAMRLGEVGLLFHPAELYSYYGLAIQRDCLLASTLVIGYTDDIIGYLPDPSAYKQNEYAAIVVPKIVDLPPFLPTAGRELVRAAVELLQETVA